MSAGNIGSGTESRDDRPVNQTSDGSCDMESNETDQSVKNFGVQIKEEPNMDDTCTYGTSSCDVVGFIEQLSDFPKDNSGKRNLVVHSELSFVLRDGTGYAVCIKYEPNASELAIDPVASVNDVNPCKSHDQTKDGNKLCYDEHQDNWQSYHENPVNSHYAGGDIKNASCKMQKKDTKIDYETVKCEIHVPENPTQKNTVPYTNNNSGNTGHNHHDHNHIFSVSYEKINGSDNSDSSPEQQDTTRKVFKCDICSYVITMYMCNVCSYSTDESSRLVIHQRKHTGEKTFKCNVCSYSNSRSELLVIHQRKHTGKFKCDVCSYSAISHSTLRKHKMKHTAEKPFKCDVCQFSTHWSSNLERHKRKHTGEKP